MSVTRADELIGYTLLNTSSITAITSTRIYNGSSPKSSTFSTILPVINFFELSLSNRNGIHAETYSINCRASNKKDARILSELVAKLFNGTSGTGIKGGQDGVDGNISVIREGGALPEPDSDCWNYPVDILITY